MTLMLNELHTKVDELQAQIDDLELQLQELELALEEVQAQRDALYEELHGVVPIPKKYA